MPQKEEEEALPWYTYARFAVSPSVRPAGKRVETGEQGTQLAFRLSSATVGSDHVHGNISIGRRAATAEDGRIARNTQQVSLGKESYNSASQTPIPSIRVH